MLEAAIRSNSCLDFTFFFGFDRCDKLNKWSAFHGSLKPRFHLKNTFVRCQNYVFLFYSFGSFRSCIGCLSVSIHGNKRVGAELVLKL